MPRGRQYGSTAKGKLQKTAELKMRVAPELLELIDKAGDWGLPDNRSRLVTRAVLRYIRSTAWRTGFDITEFNELADKIGE